MGLSEYLANPKLAERYKKIRPYLLTRQAKYDVTTRCQLRCEGCCFFESDSHRVVDNTSLTDWRSFFIKEQDRGINYINLAGAEPALVPEILEIAWGTIPQGIVYTNGIKKIDPKLGFRIHISVWGDHEGDIKYRGVDCLPRQLKNYQGDSRPVFVYTFNRYNIEQVDQVAEKIISAGHRLTFNFFSNSIGVNSNLSLNERARHLIYKKILECIDKYGNSILFSYYGAEVFTDAQSLHQQFGCPYPRVSNKGRFAREFRNYHADLTFNPTDCCQDNTDCMDCRHYGAGGMTLLTNMDKHLDSEAKFRGWLDYMDNYNAVFFNNYEKGSSLYKEK